MRDNLSLAELNVRANTEPLPPPPPVPWWVGAWRLFRRYCGMAAYAWRLRRWR